MKVILVHADHGPGAEGRLAAARGLARRCGGHVTVLVNSPFQRFVAMDPFGGTYLAAEAFAEAKTRDAALAARLAENMAASDVPWDLVTVQNEAAGALADAAALADVVLVGLPGKGGVMPDAMLAGDVALAARVPVLALPEDGGELDLSGPVLVAWNGSDEAAAALRSATPLLAGRQVMVLRVGPDEGRLPDDAALDYLARHGITARLETVDSRESAAVIIAREAERMQAAMVVMGAYGRSRLRETVFGGATHDLLNTASIPLLLAH
ncbi:universal stress protein [Altererythrobacter sp. H2]|uniref:universal stress protein n=1 Tax=Altererythrobacter sp. H2 TaxID=3108391 RepID=UPI002B4C0788|nr:universal stress protein [Altererythrobacter sp. H2]WRK95708.1 universal stress protein [Altererythrobacter sp. H2]